MPNNMWSVALHHATYLRNSAPSQALGGRSPMQILGAQAAQVSALYTFGVKCFVKIENASRTALQLKARAGIYIGRNVQNDISGSHRVLVKNPKRWDVVDMDSVHIQVHERELEMPAVLANERRLFSSTINNFYRNYVVYVLCAYIPVYIYLL